MAFFAKIKAFFLAIIAFFSSLFGIGGGGTDKPVTPPDEPSTAVVQQIRFAVASDVHIADKNTAVEEARLEKLFTTAYEYARSQEYNTLDGAFFAGDVSDRGTLSSMQKYFGIVNDNALPETTTRTVLGNHEWFTDTNNTVSRFLTASGYDSADAHLVVNGYHFILISPDKGGTGFSDAKANWVRQELEKATADDETGKRPVFVFQHHHVKDTVYGSQAWGVKDLYAVLSEFPQVVDFSGHSHFPINDERSIWQGTFTALGTGTLSYYEMGIAGYTNTSVFGTDKLGGYSTSSHSIKDAAQYYIVEVDTDYSITIKGYDLISDTFICEYKLDEVGDTSKFTYTDNRASASAVPYFAASDTLNLESVTECSAYISVPQASCDSNVQCYYFDLYNAAGNFVKRYYRLADTFYFPVPEKIYCTISDLAADTEYTVKCYAVSTWTKLSDPLTVTFRTGAPHTDIAMRSSSVQPDVFSFVAMNDGCGFDAVTGDRMNAVANSICTPDAKAGQNEVTFDGSNAYSYPAFTQSYDAIKDSFTFEFYGTPEATNGDYYDIFSNQQSGGLGFEGSVDGELEFWANFGGNYTIVRSAITYGEKMHAVATYDGTALKLYINGNLVASKAASGEITFPANSSAQHLCVGADSAPNYNTEHHYLGTLSVANIYSRALTADEIQSLYSELA